LVPAISQYISSKLGPSPGNLIVSPDLSYATCHIVTAISLYGMNCEVLTFKSDFNYADAIFVIGFVL